MMLQIISFEKSGKEQFLKIDNFRLLIYGISWIYEICLIQSCTSELERKLQSYISTTKFSYVVDKLIATQSI